MKQEKTLTLKTLTKSMAWDLQENDIFRLWKDSEKDADLKENQRHYFDIIRSAFEVEEITVDNPIVIKKYESRGFKVGQLKVSEKDEKKWAVKKRPISRVTDLTYENIRHISTPKLLEVIDKNFGGGWDSLSQSIQDIILSGFDISTTTLPKDRLHNPGGMYEKKIADDFDVLEIPKGAWVEAIFAKAKPIVEKISVDASEIKTKFDDDDADSDEDLPEIDDNYNDDDDDELDDDTLTEESYRTTVEEDPEDLDLSEVSEGDDDDY